MEGDLEAFLAAENPDEVAIYVSDAAIEGDRSALEARGTRVEDGTILVLPGKQGRAAFAAGTGTDPMPFARSAGDRDGRVEPTLDGGVCPETGSSEGENNDGDGDEAHSVRFLLAFAEEQNDEIGGIYAEGNVIHAYAQCACGTAYSDKWVVGDRPTETDRENGAEPETE